MNEHLSKTIDNLVDRIDALIVLRVEHVTGFPDSGIAVDEFRAALADSLCDFVMALKDE